MRNDMQSQKLENKEFNFFHKPKSSIIIKPLKGFHIIFMALVTAFFSTQLLFSFEKSLYKINHPIDPNVPSGSELIKQMKEISHLKFSKSDIHDKSLIESRIFDAIKIKPTQVITTQEKIYFCFFNGKIMSKVEVSDDNSYEYTLYGLPVKTFEQISDEENMNHTEFIPGYHVESRKVQLNNQGTYDVQIQLVPNPSIDALLSQTSLIINKISKVDMEKSSQEVKKSFSSQMKISPDDITVTDIMNIVTKVPNKEIITKINGHSVIIDYRPELAGYEINWGNLSTEDVFKLENTILKTKGNLIGNPSIKIDDKNKGYHKIETLIMKDLF